MVEEKTLSSQQIYSGRAVRLRVDTVQTASGRETTREIVEHSDCVAVVVIDAEDNILLVKQYRKPVEKELLEVPAGGIDAGEDPVSAVKRELREETGYLPRNTYCGCQPINLGPMCGIKVQGNRLSCGKAWNFHHWSYTH